VHGGGRPEVVSIVAADNLRVVHEQLPCSASPAPSQNRVSERARFDGTLRAHGISLPCSPGGATCVAGAEARSLAGPWASH